VAEQVLIDTGPIVAILCREDANHAGCVQTLQSINAELVACWPVISEAVFLLGGRIDRVQALFEIFSSGAITIASLGNDRVIVEWLEAFYSRFGQHKPDLADAVLMYLAERDKIQSIFTLDRRDFSIYRTSDNRSLAILGAAN
jgi:predicted nucleic acid-binding protein